MMPHIVWRWTQQVIELLATPTPYLNPASRALAPATAQHLILLLHFLEHLLKLPGLPAWPMPLHPITHFCKIGAAKTSWPEQHS